MSAIRSHLEALMRERPYNFICAAIDALDRLPNNHRLPKRALADLKRIREDLVDASVDLFHARQELMARAGERDHYDGGVTAACKPEQLRLQGDEATL